MYLYGAGSQAAIIREIIESCGQRVVGFVDDNPALSLFDGLPVVHNADGLSPMIIAVGNNRARRDIAAKLDCEFGSAIHPRAYISPSAVIGEGSVVMPMAMVHTKSKVGRHCIVNSNAVVEHETVLADFAHVAPGCTVGAYSYIGEGAFLGMGTVVRPDTRIGKDSYIGAGSVVVSDIPDGVLAYGNPCRVIKIL